MLGLLLGFDFFNEEVEMMKKVILGFVLSIASMSALAAATQQQFNCAVGECHLECFSGGQWGLVDQSSKYVITTYHDSGLVSYLMVDHVRDAKQYNIDSKQTPCRIDNIKAN